MVNVRARTVGLVALLLLVLATFVMAQPSGTDATLVVSAGQAVVNQSGTTLFATSAETAVSAGEVITVRVGDTIHLAETASAQLRLQDGSTIDLFGGTILSISEFVSNDLSYRARFSLLAGKTLSQVVRLLRPEDSFEIKTPSSTASVRGTRFTVEVISNETTYYAVAEGVVQVAMADQAVDVTAGYEVTAVVGRPLQIVPGKTSPNPADNVLQPEPDSTVPTASNNQPENSTSVTLSPTPVPGNSTNANDTPENHETPTGTTPPDGSQDGSNTPTAVPVPPNNTPAATLISTPVTTPGNTPSTPVPTTEVIPTNTAAVPTNTPIQAPTSTPALAPTNTPASAPTNTPVPPPTNTPTAEAKVIICHNGNTIEVNASAVDTHLAHGDTLGPCP